MVTYWHVNLFHALYSHTFIFVCYTSTAEPDAADKLDQANAALEFRWESRGECGLSHNGQCPEPRPGPVWPPPVVQTFSVQCVLLAITHGLSRHELLAVGMRTPRACPRRRRRPARGQHVWASCVSVRRSGAAPARHEHWCQCFCSEVEQQRVIAAGMKVERRCPRPARLH